MSALEMELVRKCPDHSLISVDEADLHYCPAPSAQDSSKPCNKELTNRFFVVKVAMKVATDPKGWLETYNPEEHEGEAVDLFVKNVVWPAHHTLKLFVAERLIPREFESIEELQYFLAEWPTFYHEVNGQYPHSSWSYLFIDGLDICMASRTQYGDHRIAHLECAQMV
jgi:hypothetical protein